MKRVTGIGGVFFKARNAATLREWYRRHLGLDLQSWGGATLRWNPPDAPQPHGATLFTIFDNDSTYFAPSTERFMVNLRVDNLQALLKALREEGCQVDEKTESSEFGHFGWVMDPEGHRVELWEPPAGPLE